MTTTHLFFRVQGCFYLERRLDWVVPCFLNSQPPLIYRHCRLDPQSVLQADAVQTQHGELIGRTTRSWIVDSAIVEFQEIFMNVLLTYAIAAEKIDVHLSNCTVRYCQTGIGKVNALLAVADAMMHEIPDVVLNVGTAGSTHHAVDSILVCSRFYDRDMERVKEFGVDYRHDFFDQVRQLPICGHFADTDIVHTCNTGDSFVTEFIEHADVVDMENFAVAALCQRRGVPLISVKYITDKIGENSVKHWEDKLMDANSGLQTFFNQWAMDIG